MISASKTSDCNRINRKLTQLNISLPLNKVLLLASGCSRLVQLHLRETALLINSGHHQNPWTPEVDYEGNFVLRLPKLSIEPIYCLNNLMFMTPSVGSRHDLGLVLQHLQKDTYYIQPPGQPPLPSALHKAGQEANMWATGVRGKSWAMHCTPGMSKVLGVIKDLGGGSKIHTLLGNLQLLRSKAEKYNKSCREEGNRRAKNQSFTEATSSP